MRILLLNQFFWPDSAATSQLLTDLARVLVENGHEVTVICADKGGYTSTEQLDPPPVRVLRVKARRFARGPIGRILSYLSFYVGAAYVSLTLPKQSVVLTLTTPPLLSLLGTALKQLRGSKHFIWEMDVYPDIAVDLGYFKSRGVLDHAVGAIADYSRRRADGIVALGDCMVDRLQARAARLGESWLSKMWVAHNWADSRAIHPQQHHEDRSRLTILYSGNIGLAHEFSTILKSIEVLGEDTRFDFRFRGTGARLSEISGFIERCKLQTISLGEFVARDSLSDSLSACHIGLVTQREICCGSVVPSKVYGLLAAGKPIIFVGPRDATPARILLQFSCGWTVTPGDAFGLTALLLHLAAHRDEVVAGGLRARQALLDNFDLPMGVARIVSILENRPPADAVSYASAISSFTTNELETARH